MIGMRCRLVGVVVALAAISGCGGDGEEATEPERPAPFAYSGDRGPGQWAELDPDYETCGEGERQSPMHLRDGDQESLPPIEFAYRPAQLEVENNGHSLEAAYPEGSSIDIDGERYELRQFHFHAPSEHEIEGDSFPVEFHFVHEAEDGGLAVLAVLAREGESNPAFDDLITATPHVEEEKVPVQGEVNAIDLLPERPETAPRWSYRGSLTTPPCTEGVRWEVFDGPIELSAEQIDRYRSAFEGNNRPLQPRNERRLEVSE
jgi:carbonic anhydrase